MEINSPNLFVEINNNEFIFVITDTDNENNINVIFKSLIPFKIFDSKKIIEYEEVFKILKTNVYAIEQKLDFIFKEVVLIIDNFDTSTINVSGFKKLNGSQLTKENISYIINSLKSKINNTEKKKTIIHIFNSKYILDQKIVDNLPIGLFGKFYSHELSFFLIKDSDLKNLNEIFNKCNLKIKKIVLKSFIDGAHHINNSSNLDTFIKININEKNSQIFFFENSSLKFIQNFKFGTDLIFQDISKVSGLSENNVREFLNQAALTYDNLENGYVDKVFFHDQIFKKIKKKLIHEIAVARIQEFSEIIIFKNINFSLLLEKKIPIFLDIKNQVTENKFREDLKIAFSMKNKLNVYFTEKNIIEKIFINANKLVHYGWKREAIPVIHEKKSFLARFFEKFLK